MHDPSHMLLFLLIVEQGSMAAAARVEGISRSTVARHLAALEDELGAQLLVRNTRDIALTQAGEVYLERARAIRDQIAEAESAVRQLEGAVKGHLRIAAPIFDHQEILSPLLCAFSNAYPDVTIELLLATDERFVVAGGFDVGVQMGFEANADLAIRRLIVDRLTLTASREYLDAHRRVRTVQDLEQHRCLLMRRDDGVLDKWPRIEGEDLIVEEPRVITNSVAILEDAIRNGLGIGLMRNAISRAEVEAGTLVHVLPDEIGMEKTYSLVYPATRYVPPKVRAFVDFTTQWLERMSEEA